MSIVTFTWDHRQHSDDNLIVLEVITRRNIAWAQTAVNFYTLDEVKERYTKLFHFVKDNERTLQGMLEREEL